MKENYKLTCLFAAVVCLATAGCWTQRSVTPLGGGYEELAVTRSSISEPDATQLALRYQKSSWGSKMIWPSVHGYLIKDDTAVFIAEVAFEPRDPDSPRRTMRRLFAVREPDLPVDITDEILRTWSKTGEIDFRKARAIDTPVTLEDKDNALQIHFAFWGQDSWPRIISLNWNQVFDMMREAKDKGTFRKDRVWGTSYIEPEFAPEKMR
jgi:hypothetical protein